MIPVGILSGINTHSEITMLLEPDARMFSMAYSLNPKCSKNILLTDNKFPFFFNSL